jgi:hypothetical protein
MIQNSDAIWTYQVAVEKDGLWAYSNCGDNDLGVYEEL